MLSTQQIATCTGASLEKAAIYAIALWNAMQAFGITNKARMAAFLAQIGHESGGLRYVREIWGPTPAQMGYEGRADLGNTMPGDGRRYPGHGLIQITGRANHAKARDRLRAKFPMLEVPDFEAEPDTLMLPQWSALSAAEFWARKGCNEMADVGNFIGITKRINGGTNGLADRQERHARAQAALSVSA